MSRKKKATPDVPAPEWSVLVDAQTVTTTPQKTRIAASEEERKALCKRLDLSNISSLSADITLHREKGSVIHVHGLMKAYVMQTCSITTDPVQTQIEEIFEGWFADQDRIIMLAKARHERLGRISDSEIPILDESEDPEPLVNGMIDIGELVVQHLSLAIDAFPRRRGLEDTEIIDVSAGDPAALVRRNPFEALKNWKKSKTDGV